MASGGDGDDLPPSYDDALTMPEAQSSHFDIGRMQALIVKVLAEDKFMEETLEGLEEQLFDELKEIDVQDKASMEIVAAEFETESRPELCDVKKWIEDHKQGQGDEEVETCQLKQPSDQELYAVRTSLFHLMNRRSHERERRQTSLKKPTIEEFLYDLSVGMTFRKLKVVLCRMLEERPEDEEVNEEVKEQTSTKDIPKKDDQASGHASAEDGHYEVGKMRALIMRVEANVDFMNKTVNNCEEALARELRVTVKRDKDKIAAAFETKSRTDLDDLKRWIAAHVQEKGGTNEYIQPSDEELIKLRSSMFKLMNKRSSERERRNPTIEEFFYDHSLLRELERLSDVLQRLLCDRPEDNTVSKPVPKKEPVEFPKLDLPKLVVDEPLKKDDQEVQASAPASPEDSEDEDVDNPVAPLNGAGACPKDQGATDDLDVNEIKLDVSQNNEAETSFLPIPAAAGATGSNISLSVDPDYSPRASTIGEEVHEFQMEEPDGDAEAGRDRRNSERRNRRRNRRDGDCALAPVELVTDGFYYTKDNWPYFSLQKKLLLIFALIFVIGLILLVSLLPASFVYVDYHQLAFVHNRATGVTDFDQVYESGCYLLAPQHTMVTLPSTAHFLDLELSVMNKEGLVIGLDVYMQYRLRPSELSVLYKKYHDDYEKIISLVAESTVKNIAMNYGIEEYRLNRTMVEASLFKNLRYALSGDCCDTYTKGRFAAFHDNATCNTTSDCSRGIHVDLAFFQMGEVSIPNQVLERYLKRATLQIEEETELHLQKKAIVKMQTKVKVEEIKNKANEVRKDAEAMGHVIKVISEANRTLAVETSYIMSLKKVFEHLKITKEEDKTSLMYLNTLKDAKDNLIAFTFDYDKNTMFTPP